MLVDWEIFFLLGYGHSRVGVQNQVYLLSLQPLILMGTDRVRMTHSPVVDDPRRRRALRHDADAEGHRPREQHELNKE